MLTLQQMGFFQVWMEADGLVKKTIEVLTCIYTCNWLESIYVSASMVALRSCCVHL